MGSNLPVLDGIPSLRKMGHIFILAGQVCQLFAFAAGLVQSSPATGAMHVIAGMAYGSATCLLVLYWVLPELQNNREILYAVLGLCLGAAFCIIIGMCIHASTSNGTPYYSTMLICLSAFLAIGGATCMILDLTGYQLKALPVGASQQPPVATGSVVNKDQPNDEAKYEEV